ncbi:MAG: hypothetical protein LH614_14330 [Pyrinomonadaceae bacterium]|nr:hypothetical protein [Pyrinomonadaceae bacterium]
MQNVEQKKKRTLNAEAFRRFLGWLGDDADADSRSENYLEMRRRLVAYFDRKNCLQPDELADETLNRVARRLDEEGDIESETPAKYCYIVARFVFLESLRGTEKKNVPLDEISRAKSGNLAIAEAKEEEIKEKMLDCLEHCTNQLEAINREIITRYYYGEERIKIENRRRLAEGLGITVNALSIRACRIRDKLEICVKKCVGKK